MPKIIPDLRNKIIANAGKLFISSGFEKTDMKAIAAQTGIGVGTLYNYFKDKTELFWEVTSVWRQDLSEELTVIFEGPASPKEKFTSLLERLLQNAEQYSGLWREFLIARPMEMIKKIECDGNHPFSDQENRLIQNIQQVLRDAWRSIPSAQPLLDDPEAKLAHMIVLSIFQLAFRHPGKGESQRIYLKHFIDFLFTTPTQPEDGGK